MRPLPLLLAVLSPFAAFAADKLEVGDKAPTKLPSAYIKGERVSTFDPKKTYVIEFWATWCPPCVASIPHLTELQAKLKSKGVTVLGVHHANGVEAADAFVRKQGKAMEYSVAKDTNGTVGKAWLTAAGQNGIPCAFVVTGGKVAYIGHPMSLTEDKVVAMIEEAKESAPAPAKK
ncbi:MAG: TlpA family protein disulfide reductase [Opitutales bacterium]|jgi:thiol-disulfide isomerase/thioredoxin